MLHEAVDVAGLLVPRCGALVEQPFGLGLSALELGAHRVPHELVHAVTPAPPIKRNEQLE